MIPDEIIHIMELRGVDVAAGTQPGAVAREVGIVLHGRPDAVLDAKDPGTVVIQRFQRGICQRQADLLAILRRELALVYDGIGLLVGRRVFRVRLSAVYNEIGPVLVDAQRVQRSPKPDHIVGIVLVIAEDLADHGVGAHLTYTDVITCIEGRAAVVLSDPKHIRVHVQHFGHIVDIHSINRDLVEKQDLVRFILIRSVICDVAAELGHGNAAVVLPVQIDAGLRGDALKGCAVITVSGADRGVDRGLVRIGEAAPGVGGKEDLQIVLLCDFPVDMRDHGLYGVLDFRIIWQQSMAQEGLGVDVHTGVRRRGLSAGFFQVRFHGSPGSQDARDPRGRVGCRCGNEVVIHGAAAVGERGDASVRVGGANDDSLVDAAGDVIGGVPAAVAGCADNGDAGSDGVADRGLDGAVFRSADTVQGEVDVVRIQLHGELDGGVQGAGAADAAVVRGLDGHDLRLRAELLDDLCHPGAVAVIVRPVVAHDAVASSAQ